MQNNNFNIEQFLDLTNEEILKKNGGRRYDIVLMNPPYSGSTHLKFLEKTIEIADKVVSIQPTRWLIDTTAKFKNTSDYNKYEDSISKHIKDLDNLSIEDVQKYFNIRIVDVGVYVCDQNGGYDYKSKSSNEIVDKVLEFIKHNKCNIDINQKDGYRVRIPSFAPGHGEAIPVLAGPKIKRIVFKDGKYNGKWWYEYYSRNQHSKITEEITKSIKFDTEEEGYNFINQFYTIFIQYVNDFIFTSRGIDNKSIVWMGNAKHPRTGNIGYKDEWKDEDFYKFFDILKEQQDEIERYIKDFEEERNEIIKSKNGK